MTKKSKNTGASALPAHHLSRQRSQKQERTRRFLLGVLIGTLLAALTFAGITIRNGLNREKDQFAQRLAGTPRSMTAEGSFRVKPPLGTPTNKKPLRVTLVVDPLCPACGQVERTLAKQLEDGMKRGEYDLHLIPLTFLDSRSTDEYSSRAVNALITVAEKDPEHLWAFTTALYNKQPRELPNYKPVSDAELAKLAQGAGVPETITSTFPQHTYKDWARAYTATTAQRSDLFPAGLHTPAMFLGGFMVDKFFMGYIPVDFGGGEDIPGAFQRSLEIARKSYKPQATSGAPQPRASTTTTPAR